MCTAAKSNQLTARLLGSTRSFWRVSRRSRGKQAMPGPQNLDVFYPRRWAGPRRRTLPLCPSSILLSCAVPSPTLALLLCGSVFAGVVPGMEDVPPQGGGDLSRTPVTNLKFFFFKFCLFLTGELSCGGVISKDNIQR